MCTHALQSVPRTPPSSTTDSQEPILGKFGRPLNVLRKKSPDMPGVLSMVSGRSDVSESSRARMPGENWGDQSTLRLREPGDSGIGWKCSIDGSLLTHAPGKERGVEQARGRVREPAEPRAFRGEVEAVVPC